MTSDDDRAAYEPRRRKKVTALLCQRRDVASSGFGKAQGGLFDGFSMVFR
jgi:hypothetical protein